MSVPISPGATRHVVVTVVSSFFVLVLAHVRVHVHVHVHVHVLVLAHAHVCMCMCTLRWRGVDLVRLTATSTPADPQPVVALRWSSATRLIALCEYGQCTVYDVTARTEVWSGRVNDLSGEDLAVCTTVLTAPGRVQGGPRATSGAMSGRGTGQWL